MCDVMIHQRHPARRKARAQLQMHVFFGSGGHRPRHRDAVDRVGFHFRQREAGGNRFFGKVLAFAARTPRDFGFLNRCDQLAVLQNGAGGVAQDAADSQNDHALPCCAFSILPQVSRSASVRLKTSFSAVESGSTQK